ncbi:cytochrome d ubiquinol oxidase subunit II [Actinoplanes sp. HUAS TT8]|uniref:cytochrome d ubiquinol oxidase subunit II n=1 Tax=Actinoplanes sp. HUAS TT8 TaxID=3447453 RepID=UPI003F524A7B
MELTTVWFLLIAVLWAGYFLLEGFDFGVGILLPFVGRDERSRRLAINTIGPVWDGNEVWLLVAGGATFAAFPEWYATLFSGFFLPLLIILVALIVRGVAFEYRGKRDGVTWKKRWDTAIFVCSLLPAVLWGVAFGNILRGVPIDADHEYIGGFFNLLNPYALLGGLTTLALFTLHGAVFLALKTDGPMREDAGRIAETTALVAVPIAAGFLVWTGIAHTDGWGIALSAAAAIALVTAIPLTRARREGWAFVTTGATLLLAVAALFVTLFPDVMPSTVDAAFSLTVHNASSTPYTLKVMTWVAVFFTPIVVLYQGWTYWIFRKRLTLSDIPA